MVCRLFREVFASVRQLVKDLLRYWGRIKTETDAEAEAEAEPINQ